MNASELFNVASQMDYDTREKDPCFGGGKYLTKYRSAIDFVNYSRREMIKLFHIPEPQYEMLDDGSIDLHWELDNIEVLINFFTFGQQVKIDMYGTTHDQSSHVKGNLQDHSANLWFWQWMAQHI